MKYLKAGSKAAKVFYDKLWKIFIGKQIFHDRCSKKQFKKWNNDRIKVKKNKDEWVIYNWKYYEWSKLTIKEAPHLMIMILPKILKP